MVTIVASRADGSEFDTCRSLGLTQHSLDQKRQVRILSMQDWEIKLHGRNSEPYNFSWVLSELRQRSVMTQLWVPPLQALSHACHFIPNSCMLYTCTDHFIYKCMFHERKYFNLPNFSVTKSSYEIKLEIYMNCIKLL